MIVFPCQVRSAFATSGWASKRTAKKTMSALTASTSVLGMLRGRIGCKAFRVACGCHGHFDALAGKRLGKSVADLTEADNCVAHIVSLGLARPTGSEYRMGRRAGRSASELR